LKYPEPLIEEVSSLLQGTKDGHNGGAQSSITTEVESPVVSVFRLKAITPPVTIKDFFKAAKADEMRISNEFEVVQNNENESDGKFGIYKASTSEGKKEHTGTLDRKKNSTTSCYKKGPSPFENFNSLSKSKTLKRRALEMDSKERSNKRSKQSKLKDCFIGKQTVKQHKSRCPVCNKEFDEKTTGNEEINLHIDQCLIE